MPEGGALLRRYTGLNRYRGFESLPLRQPVHCEPANSPRCGECADSQCLAGQNRVEARGITSVRAFLAAIALSFLQGPTQEYGFEGRLSSTFREEYPGLAETVLACQENKRSFTLRSLEQL